MSVVDPASVAPPIYIHGMGHFHPDNVIDNQFLEELDIGTSHDWIMDRVGIRSRRTVLDLDYIRDTRNQDVRAAAEATMYSNMETGKLAAEKALKAANVDADQIGMVIAGGCSPETLTPAEACSIAAALGIDATSFDLNSACSSFAVQMHFLSMMRAEALPEFVLLISPENNTRTIDYNDRSTAVLWGDGTSAAVVSTRVPSRVNASFHGMTSEPAGWDKVLIPRLGHFKQEGLTVQTFAIKRSIRCFRELQVQTQRKDLYFIGHQANKRMLESVCARCEISAQRHYFNVDQFGNTGAAGAPIVLSQHWDKFEAGDQLAMVVVGAGLTWSSLAISFGARDE
jgi:3-oxoacyl-[acyl-carrier-protein] synthase-3